MEKPVCVQQLGWGAEDIELAIATGRSGPFKYIVLADKAGVFFNPARLITPDRKGYIYQVPSMLMDLYFADGVGSWHP